MDFRIQTYRNVLFILIALLSGLAFSLCLVQYAKAIPDSPAGASNWVQLTNPAAPGGTVHDLAIAPLAPETLFALLDGSPDSRLFRSQDAALSWTQRYTFTQQVDNIALDPADPASVYAGGVDGLVHSPDGGLSWTQVYTLGQVVEVVSSTLIYAGGQAAISPDCPTGETQMARSTDGGATWFSFTLGCVGELAALAVNPQNPQIAFSASMLEGKVNQVWRSGDGGLSWQPVLGSHWLSWGIYSLVIDPQAPQHIFLSDGLGLNYSLDDGQTWHRSYALPQNAYTLAFSANSLYAIPWWGSQGVAVYRSDDGGFTWWQTLQKLPQGAWALQAAPSSGGALYAGLWAYGIWRSSNGGSGWQEADAGIRSPVWVQAIAADPEQPQRLYTGSDYPRPGLFQSQDGGLSWSLALTDTSILAIAVHPITSTIVYAGGKQGLYWTTDGIHWNWAWIDRSVQDLAFSTHAQPWLIVGGSGPADHQGFVAHYHPDHPPYEWGWHFVTLPNAYEIHAVATDPYNPYTFFAAGIDSHEGKGAGIWRSQDGGHTWQEVFYQYMPEFRDLLVDAQHTGWVYAAGLAGFYISQDGGDSWTPLNTGLPSFSNGLTQDELGNLYAAGEWGIYRLPAGETTWEPFGLPEKLFSLAARPGAAPALLTGGEESVWRYDLPVVQRIWLPVIQR